MTDIQPRPAPLLTKDDETRKDLAAAIGARAELGAEMEEHVIEAFLARVESRLAERVNATAVKAPAQLPATRKEANFVEVVAPSLALSIPLVAIAAASGSGAWGIAAVMVCVFALNFMYFVYELLRP